MPKTSSRILAPLAALLAASAFAACGDSTEADTVVSVTGTDKACKVETTSLPAGKIRFELTNDSDLTNELYVLGEKDRVISEVENVLPGTTSPLEVDLKAGTYTLACKPGQTGDGFRQKITVTGAGGKTAAESAVAKAEIEVEAREYAFTLSPSPSIAKGDAVEFKLENKGSEDHEFELLDPEGKAVGEIAAIKPGSTKEATFEFTEAGTYTYQCLVETADGTPHDQKGMKGSLTVS